LKFVELMNSGVKMAQFSSKFKSLEFPLKSHATFCLITGVEKLINIGHFTVLFIRPKTKTFKGFGRNAISLKTNVKKIKFI